MILSVTRVCDREECHRRCTVSRIEIQDESLGIDTVSLGHCMEDGTEVGWRIEELTRYDSRICSQCGAIVAEEDIYEDQGAESCPHCGCVDPFTEG